MVIDFLSKVDPTVSNIRKLEEWEDEGSSSFTDYKWCKFFGRVALVVLAVMLASLLVVTHALDNNAIEWGHAVRLMLAIIICCLADLVVISLFDSSMVSSAKTCNRINRQVRAFWYERENDIKQSTDYKYLPYNALVALHQYVREHFPYDDFLMAYDIGEFYLAISHNSQFDGYKVVAMQHDFMDAKTVSEVDPERLINGFDELEKQISTPTDTTE